MKKEPSKIKSDILLRVRLLYVFFILLGATIFIRLVWVQLFSREVRSNAERLEKRIFTVVPIEAQRGSILSRQGEPLATSIFRYQAAFDFASPGLDSVKTFHEQADSLSKLLAAFFKDKPADEYAKFFREQHAQHYRLVRPRDTTYLRETGTIARFLARMRGEEYIRRRIYDTLRDHRLVNVFPREVDLAEWDTLSTYPLLNWSMGLVYKRLKRDERVYPQDKLARRTIGLIGDQGKYGIEEAYKTELAGVDGTVVRQRIARGFSGRVAGNSYHDPVDGLDILTTLDVDLQDMADKALRAQIEKENAEWGTTIVMETRTGEILALANLGRASDGTISEQQNYALSKTMEPGSTFKLATLLTLLDDAHMPPSASYDTHNGEPVTVGPATKIQDSHHGDHVVNLRRAVAASSNVYFAEAVWDYYGRTGKKRQYSDYLHKQLHLGETVGLERLGERQPKITTEWKAPDPGVMLVKMAYGYRVSLAPIHIITLYNAVANDGRMITPLLVKEFRHGNRVEQRFEARTISPAICSKTTLAIARKYLEAVCTEGTANMFFKDTTRLRVAAKTGTAQVTYGSSGYYLGSMVAFFPAQSPRYTVMTSIQTKAQPGKAMYGGPLAGPVVKQMVDYIYSRSHDWVGPIARKGVKQYPDRIKNGNIAAIRQVAGKFAPGIDYDHRNGWGRIHIDSMRHVSVTTQPQNLYLMPDVTGMGLKDALFLLESRGLNVQFTGKGAVTQQSITAGSRITSGTTVTITLE